MPQSMLGNVHPVWEQHAAEKEFVIVDCNASWGHNCCSGWHCGEGHAKPGKVQACAYCGGLHSHRRECILSNEQSHQNNPSARVHATSHNGSPAIPSNSPPAPPVTHQSAARAPGALCHASAHAHSPRCPPMSACLPVASIAQSAGTRNPRRCVLAACVV